MSTKLLSLRLSIGAAIVFGLAMLAYGMASEQPVGGLRGRVIAQESGTPLGASIYLTPVMRTKESGKTREAYASHGKFSFSSLPAGDYKMEVRSNFRSSPPISVTIDEGKTANLDVELEPGPPTLELYTHQHIFTPDESAQVTCTGYVESGALGVSIYKVNLDAFLAQSSGNLRGLLGMESYYGGNDEQSKLDLTRNPSLTLADSFSQNISERETEGTFVQRIDLPRLAPGMYVVAVRGDGIQRLGWVVVTTIGLITKVADSQTLAYAVDLKSGAPIANADVTAYAASQVIASGKTGADGLVELAAATQRGGAQQTVVARSGDSFAFVSSYLSSTDSTGATIYAYTDRPVYRPGQKVFYKGIARRFVGDRYVTLASQKVTVEVRDPRDTLIYRAVKTTDRFGCYNGEIPLNPEAGTGYYYMVSTVGGEQQREGVGFQVAAYVKPELSVKITFPKKRYTRGQRVTAKISAQYYFGAPVANANVTYSVSRSAYWLFEGEEEDMPIYDSSEEGGYEDYGGYGESEDHGEITTDTNGEAEVTFTANWPEPKEEDGWDSDQQYTVQAYVSDKSERGADGSGSVLVTRGDFAISATPDRYVVSPGGRVNVDILAKDYDKHPIKHQELTAVLGRDRWTGSRSTFEKLEQRTLSTDGEGRASASFAIKRSGDMRVVVSSYDDKGNRVSDSAWIWSYSGAGEEPGARYPDLQIITDKKVYSPGDTARVLINTRKTGATALVTVEGDRLYSRQAVRLTGKSTAVDITVKSEYKPNFYIGVCFVKRKAFIQQEARVRVSLDMQKLNITIKPSKRKYKPGEKASYLIKATDPSGKPASAELSVGVVDEAIYAIARDRTPKMLESFYSAKYNRVNTSFSFPEIYLSDPDKATSAAKLAGQDIRIRKRFLDTAFWVADVVTDSNGEAAVTFEMPDNLTTWRATVRGITADTVCGEATNTVLVQQPMLVRLELPRFLIQGDSTCFSAIVHNYTGKSQQVDVSIEARGLKLSGAHRQSVSVADGGSERVDWEVDATKPGAFPITVFARGQSANDAMQLTLPVYPHGERRDIIKTGALSGSSNTNLVIPVRSDSIPEATRLTLRLAPSLASAMLGSLDYLAQYPYGCTEQTTSSFIPDVILSRSLKDLGVIDPRLQAQLPDMVKAGLFKLYRFQLEDGGWSWYEYGKADAWMTAYVCYGLLQAKRAGFDVNPAILGNGISQLKRLVDNPKTNFASRAYGSYVLAMAARDGFGTDNTQNLINWLTDKSQRSSNPRTLATCALGLVELGQVDAARQAVARLFSRAISEPGFTHWANESTDYYGNGADVEVTAVSLQAVLATNPQDPRAFSVVQWLMKQRQGDYWYSTRQTALVLYAMAEFLKISKELTPDYTLSVVANGKTVTQLHFTKADIFAPDREITIDAKLLRKGRNEVTLAKSGVGNLYYSAKLTQYVARDPLPATVTGAGVSVTRAYYVPSAEYDSTGSAADLGSAVTGCGTGDVVLVKLTLNASKSLEHLMLEDFIPAGFEIVDKGHLDYWEWDYWWVGRDIRDERISFYLDRVRPGRHVVTYRMRAFVPGDYRAMPAQIFDMYDPQIRATTGETEFTVR